MHCVFDDINFVTFSVAPTLLIEGMCDVLDIICDLLELV